MRAVDQWTSIAEGLEPGWSEVILSFAPEDPGAAAEAAVVLAPLQPGRVGGELRMHVARAGGGTGSLVNLLARLDRRRLWGTLSLVATRAAKPVERPRERAGLVQGWDAEVAKLPPGWQYVYAELELDSSDFLPRAALHGAPLNPSRVPGEIALRFRVATGGGYGTAPEMTRRCLARMDAEGITGRVRVLHALADTDDVGTQGPVWRVAGRSV